MRLRDKDVIKSVTDALVHQKQKGNLLRIVSPPTPRRPVMLAVNASPHYTTRTWVDRNGIQTALDRRSLINEDWQLLVFAVLYQWTLAPTRIVSRWHWTLRLRDVKPYHTHAYRTFRLMNSSPTMTIFIHRKHKNRQHRKRTNLTRE